MLFLYENPLVREVVPSGWQGSTWYKTYKAVLK